MIGIVLSGIGKLITGIASLSTKLGPVIAAKAVRAGMPAAFAPALSSGVNFAVLTAEQKLADKAIDKTIGDNWAGDLAKNFVDAATVGSLLSNGSKKSRIKRGRK